MPHRIICWPLALLLGHYTSSAQSLPASAEKIKEQVRRIGVLGNVTVSTMTGREYYGAIQSIASDRFTIDEVGQGGALSLGYSEVKRVRSGYGNTRNLYGRRIHPRTKLIVTLAVVGGLLVLVFVAVAADRS